MQLTTCVYESKQTDREINSYNHNHQNTTNFVATVHIGVALLFPINILKLHTYVHMFKHQLNADGIPDSN